MIPVVLISSRSSADQRLEGLEAGAREYLTKPFHFKELMIRVHYVMNHTPAQDREEVLHIGNLTLNTVDNSVQKGGESISLTRMECRILQLFYMNAGIPLSRHELMQQVMGINYSPLNRSIDTHINRLRKKIEDTPGDPVYIRTVRGRGYCLHLPHH